MSFAVFDPVLLADLVMLDDDSPDDMLAQVINLFVRDTKSGLLEVESTVRTGDLVSLRRRLHSIKGAGAQVGALALSEAARSFEAVLKAGYQLVNWYGLFAPAGTPPDVVAKLNAEVTKILRTPEFSAKMRALGGEANPMTPVQFGEFVRAESANFKRVIEQAKVVLTD